MLKKLTKTKIVLILLFLAFLGVGLFFLLRKNFDQTPIQERKYCVVKFQSIEYPFELTFEKGILIKDMLAEIGILDARKIYEVSGRTLHQISFNTELTKDSIFKVELR